MARVVSGLASILGRLAQLFRLGQAGHAEPGTTAPARPALHTPEEIVAEIRARRELPTSARWAWSYICYWYDPNLGPNRGRVGRGVAHVVETDAGADYRTAANEARRRTLDLTNPNAAAYVQQFAGMRLTCRRIGQPLELPTS